MPMGGLNQPEQRQERLTPAVTHRLHIQPDRVLVLDTVQEVTLVVDLLLSGRQGAVTTIVCPKET